jgi:hypothetical protein
MGVMGSISAQAAQHKAEQGVQQEWEQEGQQVE